VLKVGAIDVLFIFFSLGPFCRSASSAHAKEGRVLCGEES
jgi:hypothetical protein